MTSDRRAWLAQCLDGCAPLRVESDADVPYARQTVRAECEAAGLPRGPTESLVTAASELGHNLVRHAGTGVMAVREVTRDGVPGIEVVAADAAEGFADVQRALSGRGGSAKGLGVGLSGVMRLTDEVDIDTRRLEGSCVRARKFAEPVARAPELGVAGRPAKGERRSGDHARYRRGARRDVAMIVCDGLGHGPLARSSSELIVHTAMAHLDDVLVEVVAACDRAVREADERGGVLTLVRIDASGAGLEHLALGNVSTMLAGPGGVRRLASRPGHLGGARPYKAREVDRTEQTLRSGEVVVVFTDGLKTEAGFTPIPGALLRAHPVVLASYLLESYWRGHDDALVAVVG